ncbi:cytochrome P450 4c21 [Culex quinquefasciatus]|uniref:cytochrome P450 4c21 n=1 Tax=Culex quinquefasciatus TaxID=7176 RepID=UPI0018E2D391|nr:cytochrome P450 4c21 [Culex quinquefasciatus]
MHLLLLLLLMTFLGVLFRNHRRKYSFAKLWPEMEPVYPLIGNGTIMLGKSDPDRFDMLLEVFSRSDRLIKLWAGPKLVLCTSHPDLIRQLLNNEHCLEKPFLYDFVGYYRGLFAAKYHLWHGLRKRINPAFGFRTLPQYTRIYAKCAQRMVQNLSQLPNGATVNILDYAAVCTLDMSCAATLGIDVFETEGKDEIIRCLDATFDIPAKRMSNIFLHPDFVYRLTKYHAEETRARKTVCDFFIKLILKKRAEFLSKRSEMMENRAAAENKSATFIDQLLDLETSSGDEFSQAEINDNIGAVMSGANDTGSLLVSHACLFLAFHKDIQEKLYQEIVTALPPTNSKDPDIITPEKITELTYLDRFVKECLRLTPSGPLIARENMAEITVDGVRVPPGNVFLIGLFPLHRRKDIWGSDADQFDPDRFTDERSAGRHPYAYLPFSGGRRNCIGWRQGLILTKIILIYLIRNFFFETKINPEELRYKFDMTLKLAFPHHVQVTKRC